jgi:hypothetical protein
MQSMTMFERAVGLFFAIPLFTLIFARTLNAADPGSAHGMAAKSPLTSCNVLIVLNRKVLCGQKIETGDSLYPWRL